MLAENRRACSTKIVVKNSDITKMMEYPGYIRNASGETQAKIFFVISDKLYTFFV